MSDSEYAGELEIILKKRDNEIVLAKRYFNGLVKVSPTIYLDREKIPTYFLLQLGGGYVEGEKYKNVITLKKGARGIITTQAPTKVYKCPNDIKTEQDTVIKLEEDSILEYITDTVILYKDSIYRQINNIYMNESSTLIYTDGITSGWSPQGELFQYSSLQLKTQVYVDNKIVLLDNLLVNPKENDVTQLGFFEGYPNFGTLLVINKYITENIIEELREKVKQLDLNISFGISKLEVNGFILRVLGNLTQNIESVIKTCHDYIREKLLDSNEFIIRKY
ncbi:urease accessory protein UreD [Clostridium sp. CCUG 7971]|uniref:urease accessory protein UreD n=1 Tax=Clostridium sp. CCUG 7971 TaxID=2811414 RepID=UPI001ABB512C|nr:urease accessory protein UreD [Clostridium sp. CCUG 7971]MBO3443313.1 urease accessory protein UreD [Clostridium sp. CCUG 7971]